MAKDDSKYCRQMDISDFLPEYEGWKASFSDSAEKTKKSEAKAKPRKSSGAEKCSEQAEERLKNGTPFEDPPPKISYADKCFCLTGKFGFGSQAKVSGVIAKLGGSVQKRVTDQTDYLVVGERVNRNWINKSYGLKIWKAVSRKLEGRDILLIREEDLTASFPEKMNPSLRQTRFEDYLAGL